MSITLFIFPESAMQGDIDNVVKPILDALGQYIYIDDRQVERLLVQKFEPGVIYPFQRPSPVVAAALAEPRPTLYIRVSSDPFEDAG